MGSIRRISKDVKSILACDKKARNSDDYLYFVICRAKLLERNIDPLKITFLDGIMRREELGLPPFETVRRTRQKIQEHLPGLRANAEVAAMREVKEEEYKAYAKGVEV